MSDRAQELPCDDRRCREAEGDDGHGEATRARLALDRQVEIEIAQVHAHGPQAVRNEGGDDGRRPTWP